MSNEIVQLPLPDELPADTSPRRLKDAVWAICQALYHAATNPKGYADFRKAIGSTSNKDSVRKNRGFDRHAAVLQVKAAAESVKETIVMGAVDGDVYRHMVSWMNKKGIGLVERRNEYKKLTHSSAPAE